MTLEKLVALMETLAYMSEMGIELKKAYEEKNIPDDIMTYKEMLEMIGSVPFATNQ